MAASLDHAMWFHRPCRADEWRLYSQDSPSASGGRGLARGLIFTRDGVHRRLWRKRVYPGPHTAPDLRRVAR